MEWIKVEDKLPNNNIHVLAYLKNGKTTIAWADHDGMLQDSKGYFCHGDVTHWQPLPAPPTP